MMMMVMVVGGNNQFIAQKEDRGSLGSNGMNNDGVGIGREGEIVLKKRPWTATKDVVLSDMWSHVF
ncbi:myb-like protein A [Gossypium australe]|uniref:Myb-like protein A n=1 Tax=Gossypium australe TaxID=47621 RepID=A0A5B6VTQ5_9ROSI|nr:myb-like protein A [Gossypium australe]